MKRDFDYRITVELDNKKERHVVRACTDDEAKKKIKEKLGKNINIVFMVKKPPVKSRFTSLHNYL